MRLETAAVEELALCKYLKIPQIWQSSSATRPPIIAACIDRQAEKIMTQLYVGNLSADGDEKAIRALFSRYGIVREVLMKNGYAFVEFEDPCSADTAMRELNGESSCEA